MFKLTARLKSVKLKLAIITYLTTLIVLIITLSIYSHFFKDEQDSRFRYRVISVAKTASTLIDSDDFEKLKTIKDEKTEGYYHIRKTLQDIKRANPQILFIYTLRKTPDKNVFEFVVDADKKPYRIGEKYDTSGQEVINNALKYPVAETDFEINRWGEYLTGYAPIIDSKGKTVGVVGVDFAISTPEEPEKSSRTFAFFTALIVAIIITTALLWKEINHTLTPLEQISGAIKSLAKGGQGKQITVSSKDEIGDIANSLNQLSDSIEQMQSKIRQEINSSTLNHQKILTVYSDIIFAATKGKLRLLEGDEAKALTLEGVLYGESELQSDDSIKKYSDLAQLLFEEKNLGIAKLSKAITCIKEVASNTLKHAAKGFMQLRVLDDYIRIIILDQGPGINYNNLPTILFLSSGLSKDSEKSGFPLIIENADRIFLATSEDGTTVAIDFELNRLK